MSVLSDVFEGNWSNVGNDISHAPSSFVQDWSSEWPYLAAGAAAVAAPFVAPEILGAAGAADLGLGAGAAAGTDLAAGGLSAADAAFGAFDPSVFAAESADAAAGIGTADTAIGTVGDLAPAAALDPTLAADTTVAAGAIDPTITDAAIASGVDPTITDAAIASGVDPAALALAPTDVVGGGTGGVGDIFGPGAFDLGTADAGLPSDAMALSAPSADTTGLASNPIYDPTTDTYAGLPAAGGTETTGIAGLADTAIPASAGGTAATAGASNLLGIPGVSNMQLATLALGAAPLALTLAQGQPQLPSSAQALQGQANALSAQGQADLAAARAGQLNAGQTAQLGIMQQNLTNQWLQTLKNQGVLDPTKDSRWPQIQAQIDQQVTAATAQFLQQNMTNALAETGQAASALTSIAQMQVTQDQNFTNNLIGATKSLATVAALAGGARVQQTVSV